ncbi:MAG: ribose-5-phosphate isomerase RpiA [Polyangiaceae bacterium]|nr:ribose-5-phosphate isomerase RpiA [Polyangiaceae bacterium]
MSTPQGGASRAVLQKLADKALTRVATGMVLGLGTGRAAEAFIERLGERARGGLLVRGVPTSQRSEDLARRMNIEVVTLADVDRIDIAFDGADEVAPDLSLTKGLGGALLRERVVASEAAKFVVLVTAEKLVEKLGTRSPIPVEVVPFAAPTIGRRLKKLGATAVLRQKADGHGPYQTDNQNWIFDVSFGPIESPAEIDAAVRRIPGVVDTGLFLGMATTVLVGEDDDVRELGKTPWSV